MSSNDEIRNKILQILYDDYQENPAGVGVSRDKMLGLLQVKENLMDSNILYLEKKGLIQLLTSIGSIWNFAEITELGIDVIEHKENYRRQFPFIMTQIIHGDVHGNVVQAKDSQVIIQQIDDVFRKAHDMTETNISISPDLKEEISECLNSLEEEMKKKEPDAGKIQTCWNWLKRNASWVVPVLTQVVSEVVKSLYQFS